METPPQSSEARPPWVPLTPLQRRVLGVLIEKAKTTPAAYPMTVNAILLGCNQKNNREPVMALESNDVEITLNELEPFAPDIAQLAIRRDEREVHETGVVMRIAQLEGAAP